MQRNQTLSTYGTFFIYLYGTYKNSTFYEKKDINTQRKQRIVKGRGHVPPTQREDQARRSYLVDHGATVEVGKLYIFDNQRKNFNCAIQNW